MNLVDLYTNHPDLQLNDDFTTHNNASTADEQPSYATPPESALQYVIPSINYAAFISKTAAKTILGPDEAVDFATVMLALR